MLSWGSFQHALVLVVGFSEVRCAAWPRTVRQPEEPVEKREVRGLVCGTAPLPLCVPLPLCARAAERAERCPGVLAACWGDKRLRSQGGFAAGHGAQVEVA